MRDKLKDYANNPLFPKLAWYNSYTYSLGGTHNGYSTA